MSMGNALWLAAQRLLAPRCGAMLRHTVRSQMAPLGEGRWLDVGCGPHSQITGTLSGTVVGIDCAADTLSDAQGDGVVGVCASAAALPFAAESFDGVVSFGLLHHLSDADADKALAEMRRVTRSAGTVLLLDNVNPISNWRRPLAALLRALDRGRHIRTEDALSRLVDVHGFDLSRRITYSWTGLEACWARCVRDPPEREALRQEQRLKRRSGGANG